MWLGKSGLDVIRLCFGGEFLSPAQLTQIASIQMENFKKAERARMKDDLPPAINEEPRWKKPQIGTIKINWDAAIDNNGGRMGVGIVARDHQGVVLGASCMTRAYVTNPATAEAEERGKQRSSGEGWDSQKSYLKVTRLRWFNYYGRRRHAGIAMGWLLMMQKPCFIVFFSGR